VADEPRRGELGDLLERARLLEEMRRARDDGELVLAAQEGRGLAVELENGLIVASDDEERGRTDEPQARRGHVGPAAARDDGSDFPRQLRSRPEGGGSSGARAEVAGRQVGAFGLAPEPPRRRDEPFREELDVEDLGPVEPGTVLATPPKPKKNAAEGAQALVAPELVAHTSGVVAIEKGRIAVLYEEREQRDYVIPAASRLKVHDGDTISAGQPLTEGPLNPQDILRIQGPDKVQIYLVEEVQKVYRSQGVSINDKHIEVIARQMLRRVRVDVSGDSNLLPGELVDRFRFETENARVLAEGGEPATAQPVLLGVTKASLNTESFLAAASFQETTRVLTEAAINGQVDKLLGLKENVIIGKLIPARAKVVIEQPLNVTEMVLPLGFAVDGELGEDLDADLDDDWSDDDFEENGLGPVVDAAAENGVGDIDLVEESAPATADDPVAEVLDVQEAGAEPS